MPRRARTALLVSALALAPACSGGGGTPPSTERVVPGGPLPGLSSVELAAFERGKLVFERRFAPEDGLGPFYNATACASCHSVPTTGGSAQLYRNFYLCMVGPPGAQRPLTGLPSAIVPSYGAGDDFTTTEGRHVIEAPPGATMTVAQRNSPPLFGVGLFEFVSDATLFALSDPHDADGDGISGRFNTDAGTVGRLGFKAQSNNVEVFTRAPLKNQMGITSDPFLGSGATAGLARPQVSGDPNVPTMDFDALPDPEISRADLGDLIAFTRFLAPPQPIALDAEARHGRALFEDLGCAACHVPELPTTRFGPARAYTDLLLHDMGPDLADGISFGVPQVTTLGAPNTAAEFRTAPLWGVSLTAPFLHDGRAATLTEAIELHGGEGKASRDAFQALDADARAAVIAFLEHL